MSDTEPLDLNAIERRIAGVAQCDVTVAVLASLDDVPVLLAEVRRLREAMQSALDDIEGYGGDILWKALHPEEDGV